MLVGFGATTTWAGDLTAAAALVAESDAVCEATGAPRSSFAALMLACLRGHEAEAVSLVEATIAGRRLAGRASPSATRIGRRDFVRQPRPI